MLFLEWRLKSKWSATKLRVYRNSDVIWFKEKPDHEDKTLGKISLQVKKRPASSQKIHVVGYTSGQSSVTPIALFFTWANISNISKQHTMT